MAPKRKSMAGSRSRDTPHRFTKEDTQNDHKVTSRGRPAVPPEMSLAYGAPGKVKMPTKLRPKTKGITVADEMQQMIEADLLLVDEPKVSKPPSRSSVHSGYGRYALRGGEPLVSGSESGLQVEDEGPEEEIDAEGEEVEDTNGGEEGEDEDDDDDDELLREEEERRRRMAIVPPAVFKAGAFDPNSWSAKWNRFWTRTPRQHVPEDFVHTNGKIRRIIRHSAFFNTGIFAPLPNGVSSLFTPLKWLLYLSLIFFVGYLLRHAFLPGGSITLIERPPVPTYVLGVPNIFSAPSGGEVSSGPPVLDEAGLKAVKDLQRFQISTTNDLKSIRNDLASGLKIVQDSFNSAIKGVRSDITSQQDEIKADIRTIRTEVGSVHQVESDVRNLRDEVRSTRRNVGGTSSIKLDKQINYFAPRSGVVIDPYLTSPTRRLKQSKWSAINFLNRAFSGAPLKGPALALTPWEDMGDCWCTPDGGGKSQLAIILPKTIVPRELVLEHISADATVSNSTAPKDIELWAQVPDPGKRVNAANAALYHHVGQDEDGDQHALFGTENSLDSTWLRIGRWQYDITSNDNIQTFKIPLALDEFGVSISRFTFRTLSNWGPLKDFVCIYRLKLHGVDNGDFNETADGIGAPS